MADAPWRPLATVEVDWLSSAAGDRQGGPPAEGVYAANVVFLSEGEPERRDPWHADSYMSIVLRITGRKRGGCDVAEAGFLAPELAIPYLESGRAMLIMEGARVVAEGVVVRRGV